MGSLEWITNRGRFAAVANEWDRIAAGASTPYLLSSWIGPWLDAFAPQRELMFAALWRDDALAAAAPMLRTWRQWNGLANEHTPSFGLLAADADARERLVNDLVAQADALVIPSLSVEEAAFEELVGAARRAGRWVLVQPAHTWLAVDTTMPYETYRASLTTTARSGMGRLRRVAAREHQVDLRPVAVPDDLESQLTRAFALEASGWKGRAGTAIISARETEQFYRRMAWEFHSIGTLRLSELLLDGNLAAFALSIVHRRRVFTVKVAYDEQYRRLAPGIMLLTAMIERCFELGLDAYENSGPSYDYERRFANAEHQHRHVRLYRPGSANAARYCYHSRLRPILRRGYHAARHVVAGELSVADLVRRGSRRASSGSLNREIDD